MPTPLPPQLRNKATGREPHSEVTDRDGWNLLHEGWENWKLWRPGEAEEKKE